MHHLIVLELQNFVKKQEVSDRRLEWPLQERALNFTLRKKNKSWTDLICDVYRIMDAPKDKLDRFIRSSLKEQAFHEAATIVTKLKLQENYSLEDIVLPLLLQDKLNVMEDFIKTNPIIAHKFIRYLDDLTINQSPIQDLLDSVTGSKADRVSRPFLNKLINRLVKQYNIDSSAYPRTTQNNIIKSMRYVMYKRYTEVITNFFLTSSLIKLKLNLGHNVR